MSKLNKLFIALGIVVVILIGTNPTPKDFENYLPIATGSDLKDGIYGRTGYYGIFSIYEWRISGVSYSTDSFRSRFTERDTYIGIFKNFTCINVQQIPEK